MSQSLQQTYRHLVQQLIVRQMMRPQNTRHGGWETGGIFALFSAAALCGTLAQLHLS